MISPLLFPTQVYKLYVQQKVAREKWSHTLWANLNPQALLEGIDNFMKEFRMLPKNVSFSNTHIINAVQKAVETVSFFLVI